MWHKRLASREIPGGAPREGIPMLIDWTHKTLRLAADPLAVARSASTLPPVAMCLLRLLDGRKTVQDTLRLSPVDEETARAILRRLTELGLAHPVAQVQGRPDTSAQPMSEHLKDWISRPRRRAKPQGAAQVAISPDLADLTTKSGAPGSPEPSFEAGAPKGPEPAATAMDPVDELLAELAACLGEPDGELPEPLDATQTSPKAQGSLETPASAESLEEVLPEPMNAASSSPKAQGSVETPASAGSLEEALLLQLAGADSPSQFTQAEMDFFESYAPEEPMTDTFSDLFKNP